MSDSKQRILEALIKEDLFIEELGKRVEISPTAVRQHLDFLEASGQIIKKSVKQKMGRPKFVYSLTEMGGTTFPKAYHEFLGWMMDELLDYEGVAGLKKLLARAAKKNASRYRERFEGKSLEERMSLLKGILDDIGAYAEIKKSNGGFEVNVYNCLLFNVAKKYDPIVCEYDATLLETLLGRQIKKTRSKIAGAKCCSFTVGK